MNFRLKLIHPGLVCIFCEKIEVLQITETKESTNQIT